MSQTTSAAVASEGYAWSGVEARYGVFSRPSSRFPDTHTVPPVRSQRPAACAPVVRRSEEAGLADALDSISAAFFLVDPMRRPIHANASGRAMLAKGDVVRTVGDRLTPCDARACKTFNRIFASAQSGNTEGFKAAAVPLPADDDALWMAHVLPLAPDARRQAGVGNTAAATVIVRRAVLDLSSPLATLADTYGLTPGETRVLGAIVEFGGVPEAARALGVSETTVKTHLCHVFDKTGTKRQAELVKLVAGFANPLGM
jgi:DNA-binding CsgD family transcriptional regulator